MDLEKLDVLESRLQQFVKCFSDLKGQNDRLQAQVQELQKEKALQAEAMDRLQGLDQELAALRREQERLLHQREAARAKVEGLLLQLDRLDLGS